MIFNMRELSMRGMQFMRYAISMYYSRYSVLKLIAPRPDLRIWRSHEALSPSRLAPLLATMDGG